MSEIKKDLIEFKKAVDAQCAAKWAVIKMINELNKKYSEEVPSLESMYSPEIMLSVLKELLADEILAGDK